MKRISFLLVLIGAAAIFFSSCNKEYDEPTITWTPDGLSHFVTIGDIATYNKTLAIAFTAEAGIKKITVWKHSHKMIDSETEIFESPTGYAGLTEFSYVLTTDNFEADFGGGVTKIVYEVEITDDSETPQTTTKSYTFFVDEAYKVTINVKDGEGNAITDAKVTFNSVEKTEAPYTFEYIMEGTYTYKVEKAGYTSVNVTDFVMPDKDTTVNVELAKELSATWTGPIALALTGQESWASYNGTPVTIFKSETIGFAFTNTTATTVTVTKTDNCTGWVLVDDITTLTTEAALETAFAAGTPKETYDLPYDQHKAFETRNFVSKIGNNYLLVQYIAGHRDAAKGNVVVFQYKD